MIDRLNELMNQLKAAQQEADLVEPLRQQLAQVQAEREAWRDSLVIADTTARNLHAEIRQRDTALTHAQATVGRLRAALLSLCDALPFSREWAVEHAMDDHMVDLDHKDERDLAIFVLTVYALLDTALAQSTETTHG